MNREDREKRETGKEGGKTVRGEEVKTENERERVK